MLLGDDHVVNLIEFTKLIESLTHSVRQAAHSGSIYIPR